MKKTFLLNIFIFLGFILSAQTLPDNWTGDVDIDTYQETTIVHGGTSSCRIDVNSGIQANCDLSNDISIPVTAGNTFTFSFWAYTSVNVRITGAFDWVGASGSYSGTYVGPNTGGWTQYSYSNTVPVGATAVNLRIRSYDVTGFVAPQTQYVDDFVFESPTGTPLSITNGNMESWPTVVAPTQLAVTLINGGVSPIVNTPFDVVVQAQDNTNTGQNVSSPVNVTLSKATGTGTLGGTLTGVIAAGTNSVTISGVMYNVAETGVSITATDGAAGLTAGTSPPFDVVSTTTVSSIGALRAGTIGNPYFLSSEALLSFQQSFRNQKFIQDATGGILVDDPSFIITTVYAINDGITGITGILAEYGGMLEFVPSADPGAASSSGNTITPQVITLNDLTLNFENYESELVTINDMTFTGAGGTFATGIAYPVTDASGGYNFRTTFYSVDYIGGLIPGTANVTVIPNSTTGGNYITARSLADFAFGGLPAISKAYALSSTAVDVFYNIAPPSVDPGDYYITGTTTITFTSAVIDGTDPTIVHLTGASPAMVGDIILDEIFDDAYGSSFQFYTGIMPIAFTNTTNPGGTMLDNYIATFTGRVSANDGNNNVWVSDAAGAYNGILVYNSSFDALVAQGDAIIFSASRSPYNDLSEVINPVLISTISTGNVPYGPTTIPATAINPSIPANTNPGESWEGQLVKITNFTVDSITVIGSNYACSVAGNVFYIGNNVATVTLTIGASYASVTGVIDWYFSGPYYRINPRSQGDIVLSSNPATKLAIVSVNGGINPYVSADFSLTVQARDASNNPTAVASNVNFTFTTNGGDLTNVAFVGGTSTTGTILAGTSEIIVSGVQMAPTGDNVTITATDNNPFGLAAGTSTPFNVVELVIPDIIITEIMQNPSAVADNLGEYFEVYNNGSSAVDMNGWIIKDDGTNTTTIGSSVIVPAGGFAVLGINADPLTNGGVTVDYQYSSSFALGNADDEVVLLLPDGVTEVDRVNYDGGPVWPDPTAVSMTYTGFPNEENNDGTKWVWSTFREGNYNSSFDDLGSPGTNGYDQILTGGFKLDMKVFLENSFVIPDSMSNYFRVNSLLPYVHPFNPTLPYFGNNGPKWLFAGNDTVSNIPFLTTDWLLVELRDAASAAAATPATMVAQYPAFVNDSGVVVSMNGSKPLNISASFTNNAYIVVWSLNHLGIMSASGAVPVDGTVISYDFTTSSAQVYGGTNGCKELSTGVWGMMSGDINGDQSIDATDVSAGWAPNAGQTGIYQGNNLFLDMQIDNQDKDEFIVPNFGKSSQVPN